MLVINPFWSLKSQDGFLLLEVPGFYILGPESHYNHHHHYYHQQQPYEILPCGMCARGGMGYCTVA